MLQNRIGDDIRDAMAPQPAEFVSVAERRTWGDILDKEISKIIGRPVGALAENIIG